MGVPSAAVLAEVAENPCTLKWRVQLVRFVVRISEMPEGSLHRDILRYNVLGAFAKPSAGNWAAQVVKHFGRWVCQYLLLMMVGCQLTTSASPVSLPASNMMSGRGSIPPQGLLLPRVPSYTRITGGLHALGLFQSPTSTCPWVAEACAIHSASVFGATPCQFGWADDCIWPVLRMCTLACIWVMRGVKFSSLPLSRTFAAVMLGSLMTAPRPCACSCGIQIRRVLHLTVADS